MRDAVGWRKTMMTIGALQGTIILCGLLLRPIVILRPPAVALETETLSPKEEEEAVPETTSDGSYSPVSGQERAGSEAPVVGDDPAAGPTREASLSSGDSGVQCLPEPGEAGKLGEEKAPPLDEKEAREKPTKGGRDLEPKRSEEEGEEEEGEEQKLHDQEKGATGGERSGTEPAPAAPGAPRLLDFSVLRESSFICYSLFGLFATLGFFAPPLYVIELSVSRGVERERAAYALSAMAVAEILGRLSVGWALSRERLRARKLAVLLGCVASLAAVLAAFAAARGFRGLAACCCLYGFFMGTVASTHIPLLAEEDVAGVERMASAAGVYVFIQSFAGLAGPPLGGVLVDVTQNYGSAFYSCSVGMALGALFLGLVQPAKRGLLCFKKGPLAKPPGDPVALAEPSDGPAEREREDRLEVYVDANREAGKENGQPV